MTLLDRPAATRAEPPTTRPTCPTRTTDHGAADVTVAEDARDPADRLRADAAAVRLHVSWPGLRRTLSAEQKEDAASPFDADSASLSASKKLLDTKHPALKAASKVRHAAVSHWKTASLPYPESGVRLLPRTDLPAFESRMAELRAELSAAAAEVDAARDELVSRARRRLGDLFDPADYPPSLAPLFGLSWDLPAVEPPDYLRRSEPAAVRAGVFPRPPAVRAGRGTGGAGLRHKNLPRWSSTSANASPAARTAGRASSATVPSRTSPSSSPGSAGCRSAATRTSTPSSPRPKG